MPITSSSREIIKVRPMLSIKIFLLLILGVGSGAHEASEPAFFPSCSWEELELVKAKGMVYWQGQPFNGIAETCGPNDQVLEAITFRQGKRNGPRLRWYADGNMAFAATYQENRREGWVYSWWPSGVLRSAGQFRRDAAHGPQKQWYQSGALFKALWIEGGKEVGLQRAWRENGKLYANYEARDGRIYGLKRANLCYQLADEVLQYSD